MSEESTKAVEHLAPHNPSGFTPADVLTRAEEGDELYLELDFDDKPGIYGVWGEVRQVTELTLEDGRLRKSAVQMVADGETLEFLRLLVEDDPHSAYTSVDDQCKRKFRSGSSGEDARIESLHTIEVKKDAE